MQSKTKVRCAWCGKKKLVITAEYNRQRRKGTNRFFCNNVCSAKLANSERPDRHREINRRCPQCRSKFTTHTGPKGATFCSRSCASAGSVTAARRRAGRVAGRANFKHSTKQSALALRSREAWKYKKVKKLLVDVGEHCRFEHPVGSYVFDLALLARKVLVEFDAAHHNNGKQQVEDQKKTSAATRRGWTVTRIRTPANEVINPSVLFKLLASFEP